MPQLIYEEYREEFKGAIITLLANIMSECDSDNDRVIALELFVDDIEEIVDSIIKDM